MMAISRTSEQLARLTLREENENVNNTLEPNSTTTTLTLLSAKLLGGSQVFPPAAHPANQRHCSEPMPRPGGAKKPEAVVLISELTEYRI